MQNISGICIVQELRKSNCPSWTYVIYFVPHQTCQWANTFSKHITKEKILTITSPLDRDRKGKKHHQTTHDKNKGDFK